MTLRNQLREAIDEVAPPALDLERRVRAFVVADKRDRRVLGRREPRTAWSRRLEGPMVLVAAALVVALVAGLVLAGRYWRDLNGAPAAINAAELQRLESQPLRFPAVAPGAPCPENPEALNPQLGMVWGDGPVYAAGGGQFDTTDWGSFGYLNVAYNDAVPGLVLVRLKDLKGSAEVASGQYPLSPSGIIPAGRVLGQEKVSLHTVQLREEAVFRDRAHTPTLGRTGYPPNLILLVAMQKGTSGCIGFQFDGPGFHENFVIGPDQGVFAAGAG